MVKLIAPACSCSICFRSSRSFTFTSIPVPSLSLAPSTPSPEPLIIRTGTEAIKTRSERKLVASTSLVPYSLPPALTLPNEILLDIFHQARPATSIRGRGWYANLSLVHSRWKEAAQDCLARVVVIRQEKQLIQVEEAIRTGKIGARVEEIVFDLRKTSSGKINREADGEASVESALLRLLEVTKTSLTKLRLEGFTNKLLSSIPKELASTLTTLKTFEFCPFDAAYPLTSTGLLRLLDYAKSLKELAVRPRSQSILSLEELPESEVNPLVPALVGLSWLLASSGSWSTNEDRTSNVLNDLLVQLLAARSQKLEGSSTASRLSHVSFSSLIFSPTLFFSFTFSSLDTITSLTFKSVLISGGGPSNYSDFFSLLALLLSKQLRDFRWDDPVFVVDGANRTLVAEEPFWEFLCSCTKLRTLTLFSSLVFESTPASAPAAIPSPPRGATTLSTPPTTNPHQTARTRFSLPSSLEELGIGTAGNGVRSQGVAWWLRRVEDLLEGNNESAEEAGGESDFEDYYVELNSLFNSVTNDYTENDTLSASIRVTSSAFKELSITLPGLSRSVLRSSHIKQQVSRIRSTFIRSSRTSRDKTNHVDEGDGDEVKETVSVKIGFISIVTVDEIDLTREIRMSMQGL